MTLSGDLDLIYDAVADEMGMRISYIQSMNGSLFPGLIDVMLGEKIPEDELEGYRFLAENDNKLPSSLKNSSAEEIENYILEHAEEIIEEIRSDAEMDYYDATGENFREERIDE